MSDSLQPNPEPRVGQPRERLVAIGARNLFVYEVGTGPPLLLLHGGGPGSSGLPAFVRNVAALSRDFRVIVPDLPGYGRSSKGLDHNDLFGDIAGSIRALLDALDLAAADIVGMSLGGSCALRLALDTPDRVGRLVLVAPGGIATSRLIPRPGLRRLMAYYEGGGPSLAKLTHFMRYDLVFDGAAITDGAILDRFTASTDPEVVQDPPLRRPAGLQAIGQVRRLDLTRDPRMRSLSTPTLVLWGDRDHVNHPAGGRILSRLLPDCDLVTFSRTGHWLQWERSTLFNALVRGFVART